MFPNGYMPYSPYGALNIASNIPRNGGLLSKLGLKSINWGNLLTNTSKTLNVINQAIPVVKQVGPMFNNMKSMLKVASLFNDATSSNENNNRNNNKINNTNNDENTKEDKNVVTSQINNNSPNFFI